MKIIEKLQNKWWNWVLKPIDIKDISFISNQTADEQKRADIMKELIEENVRLSSKKCLTIEDFIGHEDSQNKNI